MDLHHLIQYLAPKKLKFHLLQHRLWSMFLYGIQVCRKNQNKKPLGSTSKHAMISCISLKAEFIKEKAIFTLEQSMFHQKTGRKPANLSQYLLSLQLPGLLNIDWTSCDPCKSRTHCFNIDFSIRRNKQAMLTNLPFVYLFEACHIFIGPKQSKS